MKKHHELVCIVCPMGCRLTLTKDDNAPKGYIIEGNICKRGVDYAIKEMTSPTRMLPTTVKIKDGFISRLPVRTTVAIPKELIFKAMDEINKVEVDAPVKCGDIIISNLLGTGADIIATRSMRRR